MGRGRRAEKRAAHSPSAMLILVDAGKAGNEVVAASFVLDAQQIGAEIGGERVTVIDRVGNGWRWGLRFGRRELRGAPRFLSDYGSTVRVSLQTSELARSGRGFELIETGVLSLRALDGERSFAELSNGLWAVDALAVPELVLSARWSD